LLAFDRTTSLQDIAGDTTVPPRPGAEELPPELLGRLKVVIPGYHLIGEIARGGQAVVYKARDASDRIVAVKLLLGGQLADEVARERLKREAFVLSALKHDNIVTVIEFGQTHEGHDFLVMNYIEGRPLDQLFPDFQKIDCRSYDSSFLLTLFLKICDAVNAAHLAGVTHRDLSPSNILIDERNEPFILDFGLARTAFDRFLNVGAHFPSVSGQFIGKFAYASPEQAACKPDLIDVRTDVYALGIILYQILTGGKFPYEVAGGAPAVLNNIAHVKPTPPSELMEAIEAARATKQRIFRRPQPPLVNATVEAVVLKALEKKPEDRYQSAGALAEDIRNYLCGKPTVAIAKGDRRTYFPAWVGKLAAPIAAFLFPLFVLWIGLAAYFGTWPFPNPESKARDPKPVSQNTAEPKTIEPLRKLVAQAESAANASRRNELAADARKLVTPLVRDLGQSNAEIWDLAGRIAILLQDNELAVLADEALTRLRPDSALLGQLTPLTDPDDVRNWADHRPEFVRIYTLAASGDRAANGQLGLAYQLGSNGLPQDDAEAIGWSRKGADAGDGLSMCNLGVMSQLGRGGMPKNIDEALRWFEAGAKAGDGRAMSFLGSIDADGAAGLPKNDRTAIDWFRKGAAAGSGRAMSCLGEMCEEGRAGLDPSQAISWYRKAAEAGDPDGMYHLGHAYSRERAGELARDESEAVRWFRKGAQAGAPAAMRALGSLGESGGLGLPKDPSEATKWYRRAARRGDLVSQVWLRERHLAW
jgi:TPR repeat protein/serine/threonine protein kinase